MNANKRVLKNVAYIFSGNIICSLIVPIFYILIARLLGVDNFGVYAFSVSLAGIFTIFSEFGTTKLIIREIASDKSIAPIYLGELLLLKPALASIVMLVFSSIVLLSSKSSEAKFAAILIGANLIILGSFFRLFDGIFQAYEAMKLSALFNVAMNFSNAIFGTLAMLHYRNLISLSIAIIISSAFFCTLAFFVLQKKFVKPILKFDFSIWKTLIRDASTFAATGLFIVIFSYSDIVMISLIKGDTAVGFYSAAYKVIWALTMLPTAVMAVFYPFLSSRRNKTIDNSVQIIEDIVVHLLVIILPIITILGIYSLQIIRTIYGNQYIPASKPLSILIFLPALSYIYIPLYDYLNVYNFQRINLRNLIITSLINIVLNSVLIPLYSYNGASIATLISEFLLLMLTYYHFLKLAKAKVPVNKLLGIALSEIIFFAVIFLFPKIFWFVSIAVGSLLYSVSLIWLKVINIKIILTTLFPRTK